MTIRASALAEPNELQAALADDAAFEAWYRRTLPRVYSYVMSRCGSDRDVAEELTQLTFIAAVEQRWRFDARSDSVTWLCGIARHKLADHYRALERAERRQMRMEVRQIELEREARTQPGLADQAVIEEAFRSLPAAQRAMLAFVAQDGLSVAEAGRLLGKSTGAAQSLLHRARESFRRAYRGELLHD
ncbi:MAG: sigma-70 family RNA polymerase sigma factor [Chloroflexi bacterium]|nr:sigma-70 family RNA polymerase sigma factor [Chloroflexota bacterium]